MRTLTPILFVLLIFCLGLLRGASAQSQDDGIAGVGVRAEGSVASSGVLEAHRLQSSITVDGQLREAAWQQAEPISGFKQFEPDEGAPASQPTEVRVLYGDSHLYLGAALYDEHPGRIKQTLGRRDDLNQADWFIASIDSYFDQKTAYIFAVNAAGVQYDAIRTGSGGGPGGGMDESWDAIWTSDVRMTSEGWVVELQIPYSMLRFSEAATQTWGIHFTRRIPRLGEESEWPLVPRTERANLVAQYGRLEGIRGIEPRRNLQVRPYTVSQLQTEEHAENPGERVSETNADVGGDLKVGLGPNVTLDATVNPDFGQVESDPAVLNLTAFETFFEERRPFFIEGVQIYEFGLGRGSDLLYTRRIGAQAPIIGAAKLSGRTAGGLSFGVLGASTGENFGPDRHYGVARMSQQIGAYSSAGGILTGFEGPLGGTGRRRSLTGGTDWDLRFADNAYGVEGYAIFSHRGASVDAEPTETGWAASLQGAKRQGVWTYDIGVDIFDDQFNPNDLGRLRRNNYIRLNGGLRHDINGGQSFGPFQRANFGFFSGQSWSYQQGLSQGWGFFSFSNWTLRGFQSIGLNLSTDYLFGGYDLFETRGLGPRAQPLEVEVSTEFETDERRDWQVEPEVGLTYQDDGGRTYEAGLRANWNVGTRLTLSGNLEAEWEDDVIAWSSNETFVQQTDGWMIGTESASPEELGPDEMTPFDDRGLLSGILSEVDPAVSGQYYVPIFGARDTRSMDLTLRSSVAFTPSLSLQLYSQLFLARGRYRQFQILQDRDTLVPFGPFPKRDDFALSSFQTNVVLRWEYRPGSNLYVVWTQGRRADDELEALGPWGASPYDRPMGDQIAETFDIFPRNVFLIKLDYTFLY